MASALTSADLLPSVSLPKTQYSTRKEPGPQTKQLPSAVVDSSGVEVKLSCQMSGSTSDVGGLDHRPPFKGRFTPSVCSHELDDRRPPSNHRLNPMLVKKACRKVHEVGDKVRGKGRERCCGIYAGNCGVTGGAYGITRIILEKSVRARLEEYPQKFEMSKYTHKRTYTFLLFYTF
eukprot:1353061-Amorphochlora_amoeboformis.AAC.1